MYHKHWTRILQSIVDKLDGLDSSATRQIAIDWLIAKLTVMKAEAAAGEWPPTVEE